MLAQLLKVEAAGDHQHRHIAGDGEDHLLDDRAQQIVGIADRQAHGSGGDHDDAEYHEKDHGIVNPPVVSVRHAERAGLLFRFYDLLICRGHNLRIILPYCHLKNSRIQVRLLLQCFAFSAVRQFSPLYFPIRSVKRLVVRCGLVMALPTMTA